MFWLGAAVSLCYVPGITGAYIATQWPLLGVVLSLGLVLRSGPFTVLHLLGVLFLAYVIALLPWNLNTYGAVYGVWRLTVAALSVWFGTTMAETRELYKGLAVGAAVSSGIAVLQFFGVGVVPYTSTMPAGLYVNSVQQATTLAIIATALVSEGLWLWALPLVPGIWLAHSRGGVIVLLVGLLGCAVRRLWLPIGILAMAAPLYLLLPLSSSDAQRTYIWRVAWGALTWFGWGAGSFYSMVLNDNGVTFLPEYAHNDYLQLAFEYGIGAALPAVVIGYAAWRTDLKEWPVVLAFCTAACFSMPLYMPIASFLSLVAVGRILRVHGLHGGYGCFGRLAGLPQRQSTIGGQAFPVASGHTAKG